MGTKTVTKTVKLIPSNYSNLTGMSASGSYPITNSYHDEDNTSYTRFSISQSTTGSIYYKFDTSDIPSTATITSVSAKAKVRVGNTTRVTNTKCQLYTGTTAKGSNSTFATTTSSNVVTLTPGTWTRSELNDLRLFIGGTGSSSSSSRYIYFSGASVSVTYSYTVTTYDVTISNSTSATVTASDTEPEAGTDVVISTDTVTGLTITDNGTDVTSQFAILSGTETQYPASYTTSGSISGTNYQSTVGKGSDTASRSGNDYCQSQGSTAYIDYSFDFSAIPENATIESVSVTVKGHCENTSQSTEVARVQLYSGSTAKGDSQNFTTTSDAVYTLTPGTWTRSELQSAKMRMTIGYYGGLLSGATWAVTYSTDGYVYTITNISANHAIVVTGSGSNPAIYYKENGTWKQATSVYKKVNGSWVLQSNLSNVFDAQTNYVKGN